MKILSILIILLTSISVFGQMDSLKKGDKWYYDYPNMKTILGDNRQVLVVHSPHFMEFEHFEGLAKVQFDMYVGFIDSSKTIVIPLEYMTFHGVWPNRFVDSRAIIEDKGKWGVIDTANNVIIPFEYDLAVQYIDSLFFVYRRYCTKYSKGVWGSFDRYGKEVLPIMPHDRKCNLCNFTYDEVLELREDYQVQDSLEKSAPFSKEKAIKKARQKGYYWEGEYPYYPTVILDNGQWIISGTRGAPLEKDFNCRYPGGCFGLEDLLIIIDANTGKIIKKSKFRYAGGRWEGQPPLELKKK